MGWVDIIGKFCRTWRQIAEDHSEWRSMVEAFIQQWKENGGQ